MTGLLSNVITTLPLSMENNLYVCMSNEVRRQGFYVEPCGTNSMQFLFAAILCSLVVQAADAYNLSQIERLEKEGAQAIVLRAEWQHEQAAENLDMSFLTDRFARGVY